MNNDDFLNQEPFKLIESANKKQSRISHASKPKRMLRTTDTMTPKAIIKKSKSRRELLTRKRFNDIFIISPFILGSRHCSRELDR